MPAALAPGERADATGVYGGRKVVVPSSREARSGRGRGGEAGDVAGLALVGGHAERGVALQMLDRADSPRARRARCPAAVTSFWKSTKRLAGPCTDGTSHSGASRVASAALRPRQACRRRVRRAPSGARARSRDNRARAERAGAAAGDRPYSARQRRRHEGGDARRRKPAGARDGWQSAAPGSSRPTSPGRSQSIALQRPPRAGAAIDTRRAACRSAVRATCDGRHRRRCRRCARRCGRRGPASSAGDRRPPRPSRPRRARSSAVAIAVVVVGEDHRAPAGAHRVAVEIGRAPPPASMTPGRSLPAKTSGRSMRAGRQHDAPGADQPEALPRRVRRRRRPR